MDREQWWLVAQQARPELTRAEFDLQWCEFEADRSKRHRYEDALALIDKAVARIRCPPITLDELRKGSMIVLANGHVLRLCPKPTD